jgi:hypothetical protein
LSITITELNCYPVKSCAGYSRDEVTLDPYGICEDRRWLVTDPNGRFLTQREVPRMAVIRPRILPDGLELQSAGAPTQFVPLRVTGSTTPVRVWKDTCAAIDQGEEAAQWLSQQLGRPCRLLRMGERFDRPVNPKYARDGDQVSFADGFPLLLISEESLEDLNRRLEVPVPMERFRPNVVVRGAGVPFAEDGWKELEVRRNGLLLRVVKPCARCIIPTIEQQTGEITGNEPLATLAEYRRRPKGIMFGQNVIHTWTGCPVTLRIGDELLCT